MAKTRKRRRGVAECTLCSKKSTEVIYIWDGDWDSDDYEIHCHPCHRRWIVTEIIKPRLLRVVRALVKRFGKTKTIVALIDKMKKDRELLRKYERSLRV